MSHHVKNNSDEIVISGLSGKFPGAQNAQVYIDSLLNKVHLCAINNRDKVWAELEEIPKCGAISDYEKFDNGHFGSHPVQALCMEPSGRLLLEEVHQALFDAGIHPDDLIGTNTGVYVGICMCTFLLGPYRSLNDCTHVLPGMDISMSAKRISYLYQLNGPSTTLDTACSSGMYAFEAALSALREGRCDRAIVATTNMCLDPIYTLFFLRLGLLNPGTGCRPFDNDANGYTRGEAVVVLILQKSSEAKRIYCSVVNCKTNSDGFKNLGITYPSTEGQAEACRNTYEGANVKTSDVGFLEAHGTGTRVGDPEELASIDSFFKPTKEAPLMIGSVKGNIGHTEPSAAACAIVKVAYALNNGQICPNIHYVTPREGIKALEEGRIKVVTETTPFPEDKMYAGVNSFGFGGANGHAVLGKYTKPKNPNLKFTNRLVCYSGRTQEALDIIHNEIVMCTDENYLSLLQENFKRGHDTHLYRGFTICGTNIRSSIRTGFSNQKWIKLIIGDLTSNNISSDHGITDLPMAKDILTRNQPKASLILFYLQAFKELGLQVELFTSDDLSKAIRSYFENQLSYVQLKQSFDKHNLENNTKLPSQQSITKWLKSNFPYSNKATIMVLSSQTDQKLDNYVKSKCNVVTFDHNINQGSFLYNIGKLYEFGFQPQIDKLYKSSNFPVSSGTNLMGHLIGWKHNLLKDIRSLKPIVVSVESIEAINFNTTAFYKGHIIDNRILFPAAGYLSLVWNMFAEKVVYTNECNVVLENIRFHRACTVTDTPLEFHLSIGPTGLFELAENSSTVVTGEIRLYDAQREGTNPFVTDEELKLMNNSNDYVLTPKDAYRELRLRGYNYRGLFRAIEKVTPAGGEVRWDNNWVTFLDNMMQLCILQHNTRSLYVPVGIERLVIRPQEHKNYVANNKNKNIPVIFSRDAMTVKSEFVEMRGLIAKSIPLRKQRQKPILESYQFIPNNYTTDVETSIRINIQLLLENKPSVNFKITELVNDTETTNDILSNLICTAIEDLPVVIPNMTIVTQQQELKVTHCKIESTMTDSNLLLVCKDPTEEEFAQVDKALIPDGFVMCFSSNSGTNAPNFNESYVVLTKHILEYSSVTEDESSAPHENAKQYSCVYFLRKRVPQDETTTIEVADSNDSSWLKTVQVAMKTSKSVVLVAQNNYKTGLLGFTNCLTKEPKGDKVSCVLLQDKSVGFDVNNNEKNALINDQLEKQMKVNVYLNGQWGTYRHVLLRETDLVSANHWYAKSLTSKDISSVRWVQGPIRPEQHGEDTLKVMYAALNFRDLMIASGKVTAEAVTTDRLLQENLMGIEYVGVKANGKRIAEFGNGGISNIVNAKGCGFEVPDDMSMEDAATIRVAYITVLYCLITKADIQEGQSILIHSGTGAVGLAALNVCTHFKCNIFVTVGNQEKREYLREHYPHIPDSHIGNSRDTSFKEMVLRETAGRGVDLVLNSLAEEKLQASVDCVADGGTFLEIGKYDLDKNNELNLALTMKGGKHISIMLDKVSYDREKFMNISNDLFKNGFRDGYIKPLPRTVFKTNELHKVFKYLGTGKHIGKVLIQIDNDTEHKVVPRYFCDPNKTYIIFGGLGGFGLELADWLVIRGAKHIVLVSRSGVTTGYQRYRIKSWKDYNVNTSILMENMLDYKTCERVLGEIHAKHPIDGIFNLAVVLKDAILENQTQETMIASLEPKAILTEYLDSITRKLCPTMSTFVVFSSVSCGLGNAGQTNYGYSNSIMERICEMRKAAGFPAVAVQWGAVGDVGLLENLQKEHNEIAIGGTLQQKVGNCLEVLDQLILRPHPIVSSMLVAEKFNKASADSPVEAVIAIMGITNFKSISPHTPFPEIGMDSMMAVEIKQTLERDFDISLTPTSLRTLTFAKLEEMSSEKDKPNTDDNNAIENDTISITMVIQGIQMSMTKETLVDFNKSLSTSKGDFVLAFPGIEADHAKFELLAKNIKKHVKTVCYDSITSNQENVDVIVNYLFNTLKDEIQAYGSFKFIAHSIGNLAAIELAKRFEAVNITGQIILVDGAPTLMYRLYNLFKGESQADLECRVIMNIVSTFLPQQSTAGLLEMMLKCETYAERIDVLFATYLSNYPLDLLEQLKKLMSSFNSRLMSVVNYQNREKDTVLIKSQVLLCKPNTPAFIEIAEDYDLNALCEEPIRIETYDGNHKTVLFNEKMHQQCLQEFSG